MPMTDDELAVFLYPPDPKAVAKLVASMPPERRAIYDKMKAVQDWDAGGRKGPPPVLVLFDGPRRRR